MRHNRKVNHLGRKSGHRKAMLSNMASSLIMNKRIETTEAKAKALKPYVEPLITKSKEDTTQKENGKAEYEIGTSTFVLYEEFRSILSWR